MYIPPSLRLIHDPPMDSSVKLPSCSSPFSSCISPPQSASLRRFSSPTNFAQIDAPPLFSANQILFLRCSNSNSSSCRTRRREAFFRKGFDTGDVISFQRHRKSVAVTCSVSGGHSEYYSTDSVQEGNTDNVRPPTPLILRISEFQDAFWRFLRPHTIRGTIIGTTAVVVRALLDNSHLIDWGLIPKALCGLLALLCGNGYIVGINQIYDIGIDKVNKPFLPVAAGDLSVPAAWALVITFAIVGISIVATNFGPLITGLYILGLSLGAIYSVPPLRLKRFAVPAFLIIATVRGFLLNFGVYYATRSSLGLKFAWSPPIIFITFFVTLFATVIAITKDLPDIEGDLKFKIATFATELGVQNIAFLGSGLLLMNYFGAMLAAYLFPQVFKKGVMVISHAVLASALLYQTWLLDASKYTKEAIATYYRFIWNLFYAEYALFPWI